MLTKAEITTRLGITESTLKRWADHGLVARHAYSGLAYLYEAPSPDLPTKKCSRWDRLTDRAAALHLASTPKCANSEGAGAV
jgi:hypothetical protein